MTPRIQGMGWVTPFGRDFETAWDAVKLGRTADPRLVEHPFTSREWPVLSASPDALADVARIARIRRASTISHLAMAAAMDAIRRAGCDPASENVAVVFAATNGGVIYTRRFYADVSTSGVHAGSPLLFPETVYNAPVSHIAAQLGVNGVVTTIVNDATAGIDAFAVATELLESNACDRCLVVGAEEFDWVVGEACESWSLVARGETITPFRGGGTIFAEGAAAVLLGREGGPAVSTVVPPRSFRSLEDGTKLARELPASHIVISSASGTKFDAVEQGVGNRQLTPKAAFGEVFATSSIQAVVCAALALADDQEAPDALVLSTGFSAQFAALRLTR